jgi:signal transduction histidine kinase
VAAAPGYTPGMLGRLSLANKCLLVFGGAIVLIVLAALCAPWLRMNALVDEGQLELSRRLVDTWEQAEVKSREPLAGAPPTADNEAREMTGVGARRVRVVNGQPRGEVDEFVTRAAEYFQKHQSRLDFQSAEFSGIDRLYRYARVERSFVSGKPEVTGLIILERKNAAARRLLIINTAYLLSAGSAVLGLALLVFYQITHRLILRPVRELRDTAERVREGNLQIRSTIATGDEFEELAETFNSMLTDLQGSQDQLRAINLALDLKLNELAESNVALSEAAKLKGDFLASVSHELRTPLNSIIGFTELLLEHARADQQQQTEAAGQQALVLSKRVRYLENIQTASRNLLELINSLLEMAKIEAGRVDVKVETVSLRDVCEGLAGLMFPIAEKKGIELSLEIAEDLPMIRTDGKKLQQIVFNFLSNAVKFTDPEDKSGRQGLVTLRAEKFVAGGPGEEPTQRVRISVIDNGPGIPQDEQRKIFDKFYRMEQGHTREHAGTGLGLAISRELAAVLQGEVQLVSDVGRGSMFSLILPLAFDPARSPESGRGKLHASAV